MELITKHIKELQTLCLEHKVNKLYVFGSILTEEFTSKSDIDFLVQFNDVDPLDYFDNYMNLKESFEKLFNKEIDLLEVQTVKNPILKRSIDRNKKILYGRENPKVAV